MKHLSFLLLKRTALVIWLFAVYSFPVIAQHAATPSALFSKISTTPESALTIFREAGMDPVEHQLTAAERSAVDSAFTTLPPMHQRILKAHLEGISFLDNMPNTALTSIVKSGDSVKRYHITFRAAILHQTVSQWLKEKEQTCFTNGSGDTVISFDAGHINAIIYVLLHETTHIVDGSVGIFDDPNTPFASAFLKGVWADRTTLVFQDTIQQKNHFRRSGLVYPIDKAPLLYKALLQTPLVSLYSTSSRSEDLAECLTIFHFTQKLKQPFKMLLTVRGKTIVINEPVKRKEVWNRMKALSVFYETDEQHVQAQVSSQSLPY